MKKALLRFYAELNDFLVPERKHVVFWHSFWGNPAVKDVVESRGVPHTEVGMVLVNSIPVDLLWNLENGDRVSVYPEFRTIDLAAAAGDMFNEGEHHTRFVLDVHLGKLAAYLRMLGFDTYYKNNLSDHILADISYRENRVLLTRDLGLLKRGKVKHGYYVRSTFPRRQLKEVVSRFQLENNLNLFKRCMRCNQELTPVNPEEVSEMLPAGVRQSCSEFSYCQSCKRVFWKGTHYYHMLRIIEEALEARQLIELKG